MFKNKEDENLLTICKYNMAMESSLSTLYPIRDLFSFYLDADDPYIRFLDGDLESYIQLYFFYQDRVREFIKNKIKNGEDVSIEEVAACADNIIYHMQNINPLIEKIYDALIKKHNLTDSEERKLKINDLILEIKIYGIKNDIIHIFMNRKKEDSYLMLRYEFSGQSINKEKDSL